MQTAQRAIRRLAFIGWLGLLGTTGLPAQLAQAAAPPERVLPENTLFFLKLSDVKSLRESFRSSQYGQLWNDPALKDFREDLAERLQDASKALKDRIGVSIKELVELPQGALAIAVLGRDDPNLPAAGVLIADAGENQKKLEEVFDRASKQAEEAGAKVAKEPFNGLTLHVIQPPKIEGEKDNQDKDKAVPRPPLVWTNAGSLFFITSDVEIVKDLAAHREGRDDSLAGSESFAKTVAKTDSAKAQVTWYFDVAKIVKLLIKASAKDQKAQAEQNEILAKELGVFGLKSVGGSMALGAGAYDSLTKTFFNAPKPVSGVLKIFSLPPVALRPESWVPATVATYQTVSWDLDNAFDAIEAIIEKFQPGMIQLLQQQLVGPNGGQPLSFKNDIFGPLGNRISVISDFKKPINQDSQRMLVAVALDNSKAFQDTLAQVLQITNAAPEKRQFQGTTIYDFNVPVPNPPGGNAAPVGGARAISMAIAKNELFITTDATLLEQVLRPGNPSLADSSSYQTVAKEFPERMSGMSYVRPNESARLSYDMVKNGTFAKAIGQAMAARQARDVPDLNKLIPVDKLPDFAVFAKYLSLGGSCGVMDDDGFTMTGFALRHANP